MDSIGYVDEVEPSLELVYLLLGIHADPEVEFEARVAAVAGWERLISWATAMQAEQLVAIDRGANVAGYDWVAAERSRSLSDVLGLALQVSGQSAAHRLFAAETLIEKTPAVHDALKRGAVTTHHARFAATAASSLPEDIAQQAAAATMVDEDWRTPAQFANVFARHVIALDPDGAEERAREAAKTRGVSKRNEPDGMASLYARLLAEDCAAVYDRVDASARSSLATNVDGDERTLDARRADALVQLVLGQISNGYLGDAVDGPPCPAHHAAGTAGATDTAATTDTAVATAAAPETADSTEAAAGPEAAGSTEAAAATDTAAAPTPANTSETATASDTEAATETAAVPAGTATTEGPSDTSACTCGERAVAASEPTRHGRKATVHVTVAWSTLIGLDQRPAHLANYGPIDAATARRIAADPTSTWYRLLTDPTSGQLLDFGRTKYRPPQDLQDFVMARDRCCRFPGCERIAAACDLDHRTDWDHGGTTCPDCLCRRHHLLKHQGGWTHWRDPATGDSVWTDPHGHQHLRPATILPNPEPVEPPAAVQPALAPEPVLVDAGPPPF